MITVTTTATTESASGATYNYRDALRRVGCRWDAASKSWSRTRRADTSLAGLLRVWGASNVTVEEGA